MHKHFRPHKYLFTKKVIIACAIAIGVIGILWYFYAPIYFVDWRPVPEISTQGFRGPTGAPHVNGPTGPPPTY
ncbi:MAG: hypothetical protein Q8P49_02335 [Candidatus Liptonbacteria bacterium]|nr:hypothetical protein [Candidatus Liptonbacteria bacterium]